jgi:hypothetical protein
VIDVVLVGSLFRTKLSQTFEKSIFFSRSLNSSKSSLYLLLLNTFCLDSSVSKYLLLFSKTLTYFSRVLVCFLRVSTSPQRRVFS